MALDAEFLEAVGALQAPKMGTELMAPLLYSLVRSARPRSVLEVGMGYTTPYLARALADNRADFLREREALGHKARAWLADPERHPRQWMEAEPTYAAPQYYCRDHLPMLYAIDDLSADWSSAPRVEEVLRRLGLDPLVSLAREDFRGHLPRIPRRHLPFDLAWFDCGSRPHYFAFFEEYWSAIRDDGGLVILHWTLTQRDNGALVAELKRKMAVPGPGEYELISLLEPHKLAQNSFTAIRKTAGGAEPFYEELSLEEEVRRFLTAYESRE
jgi:predicted O-methyltransferase YrrM